MAAHIAESARGGAGSVGERLQKYSSFGRFLPDEEYAAATHDFAEPNLPDQQLTARAAKELHIVQACKLIACLRLAHRCVRSERQMAGEQPCRPVKCVTRRLNRMRTTYHGSPTLSPPARNRGKVHPPARLGQGLGHFPRARIWDTAPNPGCLDVHLPSHSDCGDCPWARSRTGGTHILSG